jgi:hypothetical protein
MNAKSVLCERSRRMSFLTRVSFEQTYRLAARGGSGLACDDAGVALGPVVLIDSAKRQGRRIYRTRPADEIARTLALAYAPFTADDLAWRLAGLDVAARALEGGDLALATVATVLLKLPPLTPPALAALAAEPTLKKTAVNVIDP